MPKKQQRENKEHKEMHDSNPANVASGPVGHGLSPSIVQTLTLEIIAKIVHLGHEHVNKRIGAHVREMLQHRSSYTDNLTQDLRALVALLPPPPESEKSTKDDDNRSGGGNSNGGNGADSGKLFTRRISTGPQNNGNGRVSQDTQVEEEKTKVDNYKNCGGGYANEHQGEMGCNCGDCAKFQISQCAKLS